MSKIKVVFAQFLSNFLLVGLFILRLYDSKYARNDSWLDTIKICLVSQWLCKFFLHFWKKISFSFSTILFPSVAKTNKKTAKAKHIVQFTKKTVDLSIYWAIQAQNQKKTNQNLDKKWAKTTLNFDTFYLRLLRLSEVKIVSNGWSGINFHYSGPHQA